MTEKNVEISMSIILHAGDARVHCMKAFDAIAEQDFDQAKLQIKEATKSITSAHQVQTDAIQLEAATGESEYSVLFAHAQDTLMTIYCEINVAKKMIGVFQSYEERISRLEKLNG